MTPALREGCARALHVVTRDGVVLRAGRATLFILEGLGWGPVARLLMVPPFVWLVEGCYRLVANHRGFFARLLFRRSDPAGAPGLEDLPAPPSSDGRPADPEDAKGGRADATVEPGSAEERR